ncbi:MAG: hypothetical protein COT89_01390 [Candidatus Colwellbacteria bacterium CG10_big_fil_rev_8_21_14_0_10_42_22]|uniref:Uncharacterized protein n=1 Tax=Candidatus Colwellbacteria bacterium CG10_big_fil_rev_8_21_14_0_10_42_22 TaxID=1974540 RepID=A0A2H0VG37_9BACT|nr:MAG: hypothetical protein COT89_01390 [Candidatus Colwellbacteria bacterium CG10_big_fil_rev_8_21_14_0_10_42_22]
MNYLKSKGYYSDLYDQTTVERCRWIENFHKEYKAPKAVTKDASKDDLEKITRITLYYDLLFTTGERYLNKEKTIQEWIERDTAKDELYNSAEAPEGIRCLTCSSSMTATFKDLHSPGLDDAKDRVFFMYDCPNKCLPRRAFFDDGEEWKPKPHLCPKCGSELKSDDERKGNKIITTETCVSCSYKKTDELDLSPKKEKVDKDFEKDKARFCLTEEKGQEYIKTKGQLEGMKQLVDELKERDENKDLYDKVAKLKKLTIVQLQKTLAPVLEKKGYIDLSFETPEMEHDVRVAFTVKDGKDGREEYDSRMQLKKSIEGALRSTNWHLMSDGVTYRLGILMGRLRGYEREEDLLKLVERQSTASKVSINP